MLYWDYEGNRFPCSLLTTSKSRNMQGRFVTDISTKNAGSTDRVPIGAEDAIWVHVLNNSKIEKWATFVVAYIWEECSVEYLDPWGHFLRVYHKRIRLRVCFATSVASACNSSMSSYYNSPEGSKDSNNGVLGPKYYNLNGIWDLKPCYLGPWTLR